MFYEIKKDNLTYFYNVTYEEDKLIEILEQLKKYNYVATNQEKIAVSIPSSIIGASRIIKKQIISQFNKKHSNSNNVIHPETIVFHREKDNNFITCKYSYDKLPKLYYYIDIVLNNKPIMCYADLFKDVGSKMFYNPQQNDQKIIDAILNYENIEELFNHNLENIEANEKYDYIGLMQLYKKTLKCFNFSLIAIKKNIEPLASIDGLSIQKKISLDSK